jgi:hypothetical protein
MCLCVRILLILETKLFQCYLSRTLKDSCSCHFPPYSIHSTLYCTYSHICTNKHNSCHPILPLATTSQSILLLSTSHVMLLSCQPPKTRHNEIIKPQSHSTRPHRCRCKKGLLTVADSWQVSDCVVPSSSTSQHWYR